MVTHLIVQDSAFLDLGLCILAFLQSLGKAHSPESVCGILDKVSESWGASIAPTPAAAEVITAAAARKPVTATLQLLQAPIRCVVVFFMMPLLLLVFLLMILLALLLILQLTTPRFVEVL